MALENTSPYAFGTGDDSVIARTQTKEFTINVIAKDNLGNVAGTARGGKKTTTTETKYGDGESEVLDNTTTRVSIAASNEDFTKVTVETETYE